MILFEIDIPIGIGVWLNYESGVYACAMAHERVEVTDDHGVTGYYPAFNAGKKFNIRSVRVNMEYYSRTVSVAECRGQEKSFYWDFETQILYVHFDDSNPPEVYSDIKTGKSWGFSQGLDDCYINNMYYEPRLKSVGSINRKTDNLFAGILTLNSFTATILNGERGNGTGFLDEFKDEDLFGVAARVLTGNPDDAYGDLVIRAEGFIDDLDWTWREFRIKVTDKRDLLTRKIPVRTFDKSAYPNLLDDSVGKPIPLIYGTVRKAPLVYVDSFTEYLPGANITHWRYCVCDTSNHPIQSVTSVYVERDDSIVSVVPNYNVNTGQVWFPVASGETEPPKAYADVSGFAITNALDIIVDLLNLYCDIRYTSTFYNLTEWAAVRSSVPSLGLYIGESDPVEVKKIIEEICISAGMMFYPTTDGKFTVKKTNLNAPVLRTIKPEELNDLKFSKPRSEYLSSVVIKYNKAVGLDGWEILDFKNYEQDVYHTYSVYQSKTYETAITSLTDATARAEEIMAQCKTIGFILSGWTWKQHADLDIEDHVYARYSRITEPEKWGEFRVIGNNFDPQNEKTQLTLKWIRDYVPNIINYAIETDYDGAFIVDYDGATIIGEVVA